MKNPKLVLFVVVIVIISLSCNFLFPDSQSRIPNINSIGQSAANLPLLDPEAPLPSPGAAQLRTLVTDEPGGAALIIEVATAEQAALKAVVADLQAQLVPTSNIPDNTPLVTTPYRTSTFLIPSSARQSTNRDVLLVSYNQTSVIQPPDGGLSAATLIGLITSMFADMFSSDSAIPTQEYTATEKEGNVISDMSLEIGKSADGSDHFSMGLQSKGTKNGVSVKTDLSAAIDGQRCPTADGQVSFSIKARINSEAGGVETTQDLTTFVRATVNDDAEIASSTFDIIQGTLQIKGGRQVYLETGETIKFGQDYSGAKQTNWHVNQNTDNATGEDQINLEPPGLKAALELGISSLSSAKNAWQSGKCIKIVATSPGTVQTGSTTAIPVNVISVFGGSNAPSKLKAVLTGGESIDPTSLAKTPGTLTYTAPNENGKSATILLTATSKRGKAKLELTANTGEIKQSYQVIETLGLGRSWTGACIDDLATPFSLSFTAPEQTVSFSFSPVSSTSGSLTEKIHFALGGTTMDYSGGGNYEIIPTDKDPEGNVTGMEIAYNTTGNSISCGEGKCVTNKMEMGKGVQIPLRVQKGTCSDQ